MISKTAFFFKKVKNQKVKNQKQLFIEVVSKCSRPSLNEKIPTIYQNLISSCWEQNPNERPDFITILNELKNNKQFITNKINKTEYLSYANYI